MIASEYYKQELFLAAVDRDDTIIGKVERWKAHTEGILHRGFTAMLQHRDQILLQHRKHIAFDDTWDLTFSSHQIYLGDQLQHDDDAIRAALIREWGWDISSQTLQITSLGSVYYKEKDKKSIYTEHEIDRIFLVTLDHLPVCNTDFAYGYESMPIMDVKNKLIPDRFTLAPWVRQMVQDIHWPTAF